MAPKLYWLSTSPPARVVIFCAKELGIELELIEVNLSRKDHLKPEFLKMNPQHTVPVLDDDGFTIWESHAIMLYLVEKYGENSSLYPNDARKRAIVHQRQHFDSATLFPPHLRICVSIVFEGALSIPEDLLKPIVEAYGFLEIFLQNRKYVAGDDLTIADLSIWATISNEAVYLPIDEKIYPNITKWMKLMEKRPYNDINTAGLDNLRVLLKTALP